MCSMSVLCPLCAQTSFTSIDALRNSLIKAANGPLACPICFELFLGLDKLTIHLFSHTNLVTHTTTKVDDVSKNSIETKSAIKSPKSPIHNQHINGEEMVKKVVEENIVLEKKTKRCKQQVKASNKPKDTQQETTTPSTTTANQYHTTPPSTLHSTSTKLSHTAEPKELAQLSTCDICEYTFRNEILRDMHFRLVHQNSPPSMVVPSTSTSISSNSPALSNDTEFDFKCHLCAKTFKMKGSLRVHLKVVHMIGINYGSSSPKLGICDRIRYKEVKNLQNTKSSTTKATLTPTIVQPQIVVPVQNTTTLTNSPNTTDLQLGTLTLLSTQQIKAENQIPIVQKTSTLGELTTVTDSSLLGASNVLLVFTPQSGELNMESFSKPIVDNPKIWECDVCSKSFTTKYFLKKHKRLHTGEMPYSCEICARTFTFQQSYHKHLLYHSDEKPHICAVCGRAFKELSTLHNHERIHSGEKPFKCEICGKCFRQRVSFLVHTRIHTGVMPYKCELCDNSFRYKVSLRTHKCLSSTSQVETTNNAQDLPSTNNNPEGINDHLTENFIKAFLESTTGNSGIQNESQHSPASLEIATITDPTCLEPEKVDPKSVEALLSKSIDDIVVESCNKMGIGNTENMVFNKSVTNIVSHLSPSPSSSNDFGVQNFSDGSNSPLQKLQNMRLQSPKFDMQTSSIEQNVQFPHFLFDSTCNES